MAGKSDCITVDGNEAVAIVAYQASEVIAIYPITPASPMGEWADAWSAQGMRNLWGTVPAVVELQSEGGAAGAVHGALQTGALATTFTASQGLLLMIPNLYKIAGELTPMVIHVAARSLATHALSIFGDHGDVMAARSCGFAMLCSASVQEAMDFALVAQSATLDSRIPFLHFFDGFRTSHEVAKIHPLTTDDIRSLIDEKRILEHRARALTPDKPVIRGTAQNPDVYFQAREAANGFYDACPDTVQAAFDRLAKRTGRPYHLFDYCGAADADRVIVIMGSGADSVEETVAELNKRGEKTGLVKVRLYRPFDVKRFVRSLPARVRSIAVLDRTKEPGSGGEPLYLDCIAALREGIDSGWAPFKEHPRVIGGRYGLSSKEFTPAMVKGIFDHLKADKLRNHFTIGIDDDVTKASLPYDEHYSIEPDDVHRAIFYGLGADGTVGANKNTIKIIGENTDDYAQGYFVYDSKKSGAITVSHLRFGPRPFKSPYLVTRSNFVGCHQWIFVDRYDLLEHLVEGGVLLLNSPYGPDEVWEHLPAKMQEGILKKKARLYVIDAYSVARQSGIGDRINVVMQVCFFAIANILTKEKAIEEIKTAIRKTYGKKGEEIVRMNLDAVDHTLAHLSEVKTAGRAAGKKPMQEAVSTQAPEFVKQVLAPMMIGCGDRLPVSKIPVDGTFPSGTARWEKRNIADQIPVWDSQVCIQCGKCSFVCPHAVIRIKAYGPEELKEAPPTFKSADSKYAELKGLKYTIQVSPEDCTGCGLCVDICPARNKTQTKFKAINMAPQAPLREPEKKNWEFFLKLPEFDRLKLKTDRIHFQQLQEPLFEFSGACAGCGETPYVKLVSQLFGDRMVVANATGCSSIYGGNLPTTPWTQNAQGRGPAWSNSLFEDNAEFGLGMRVSIDKQKALAGEILQTLSADLGDVPVKAILEAEQNDEAGIYEQRRRVEALKAKLKTLKKPEAAYLAGLADYLVKKSVWIIGGDGWAYDIGYGGLDHVLASGRNVNVLVLDTEVYSNTGGQMSKATPKSAVAKFASGGKNTSKKDLGLIAMTYGGVYVASVSMGAKDEHTLKAFIEAESYDGPSLIIAYSHCIAHGINMTTAMQNQKAIFQSGIWPIYRFDPRLVKEGKEALRIETPLKKIPAREFLEMESRFKMLTKTRPDTARKLFAEVQDDVDYKTALYRYLGQFWAERAAAEAAEAARVSAVNATLEASQG